MHREGMVLGFLLLLLLALLIDQLLAPAALLPLFWKNSTEYQMNGRVGRPQGWHGQ
jgi:hypothetical protein